MPQFYGINQSINQSDSYRLLLMSTCFVYKAHLSIELVSSIPTALPPWGNQGAVIGCQGQVNLHKVRISYKTITKLGEKVTVDSKCLCTKPGVTMHQNLTLPWSRDTVFRNISTSEARHIKNVSIKCPIPTIPD